MIRWRVACKGFEELGTMNFVYRPWDNPLVKELLQLEQFRTHEKPVARLISNLSLDAEGSSE